MINENINLSKSFYNLFVDTLNILKERCDELIIELMNEGFFENVQSITHENYEFWNNRVDIEISIDDNKKYLLRVDPYYLEENHKIEYFISDLRSEDIVSLFGSKYLIEKTW